LRARWARKFESPNNAPIEAPSVAANLTELSYLATRCVVGRRIAIAGNKLDRLGVSGTHQTNVLDRNHPHWEIDMKVAALGLCIAALMLGACRRETPDYTPMKLGGTSASQDVPRQ
jgi:hypothetical protein